MILMGARGACLRWGTWYVFMHVCMIVCMYVCIYVCMYDYMYELLYLPQDFIDHRVIEDIIEEALLFFNGLLHSSFSELVKQQLHC